MFNVDKRDKDKSRTTLWLLLFLCRHAYEEMVSQSPRECISTVPLLQGLCVGVEEISDRRTSQRTWGMGKEERVFKSGWFKSEHLKVHYPVI